MPNGNLVAIGPFMPELFDALGNLQILYANGIGKKEYLYETLHCCSRKARNSNIKDRVYYQLALVFLIIHGLMPDDEGKITFKWLDFSQTITLRVNPFINAPLN